MLRGLQRTATIATALTMILIGLIEVDVANAQDEMVKAGTYDNGKMWTFDYPPAEFFRTEYGIEAGDDWFEKARLSALRLPNCTASFVSPTGLVMTNHHCARGALAQVSQEGEQLLDKGFYARSLEEERPAPMLWLDQLVAIDDVTDEVYAALEGAETIAERSSARSDAINAIQERKLNEAGGEDSGHVVQVVSLYSGGRYSAYTFRRYSDVRIVMAPEIAMGHFGGDHDNFTFPRYALDMSFLRVYVDGEPYRTEDYFKWSVDGAEEGDPVFVIGNPGSTNRLESVAQLEYRRDYRDKLLLEFFRDRLRALRDAYAVTNDDRVRTTMLSASNVEKLYTGRVKGLNDANIMARRADSERQFLEAIAADPALQAEYGTLIEDLAALQPSKAEFEAEFITFLAMAPGSAWTSVTLQRALMAQRMLSQQADGASDEAIESMKDGLLGISDGAEVLDRNYLTGRIAIAQKYLGSDASVALYMDGRSAEDVAQHILDESVLTTAEATAAAVEAGTLTMDDPAVMFVESWAQRLADYQSGFAGLTAQEGELGSKRGRAQYDVYGLSVPPDATFSLRIADGVVQGYEYNGTEAPPYTTFYGLYDHYHSYHGSEIAHEWDLPERWLNPPAEFDLSTPINIVSTNDIIGGNSGSPMVSKDLEVVGLVFDGNIESLPSAYIFTTDVNRSVSVDARGILESLDSMFDMDRIVLELTTGQLVGTEAEADAVRMAR
ncbi:MAG: S46 family peptidase [Rhodothermales bacterium]|nr:S46 family peptidase [Rhodothermales bacterium]